MRYNQILEYKKREIGGTWKRVDLTDLQDELKQLPLGFQFTRLLDYMDDLRHRNQFNQYRIIIYHAEHDGH